VLPDRCHEDPGYSIKHFNTKEFFNAVKKGVYERYEEMKKEYGLV